MSRNRRQLGLGGGLILGGVITTGVCLLLMVVFSIISWPPWADSTLDGEGLTVDGVVVGQPTIVSHNRGGQPNRVRLRVRLEDGPRPDEVITLTARPSSRLIDGAEVAVDVLRDDATLARLNGDSYGIFGLDVLRWLAIGPGIGLVLIVIGLVFRR